VPCVSARTCTNISVIADRDQAIYGFREAGASFTRFGADHPTARALVDTVPRPR
jgi:superfamily I DNA/RNA helicase